MSALRKPGQTSFAFLFDLARTVDEMKREIETRERKPPRAKGKSADMASPGNGDH